VQAPGPAGITRRTVTAACASAAALLLGPATAARADARPSARAQGPKDAGVRLALPAPTGPFPIGVTELYLVDASRPDPWDPSIPVRELMVSVFYPARPAPLGHPQLPAGGVDWAATLTHAHTGVPALPGPWPVLLYSPGGGDPRTLGTCLAEELASRGHVVVTIDHPGDAADVAFPTTTPYRPDQVRITVLRGDPRSDPAIFRTMMNARVADTRFVLDQIEALAAGRNPDALGRPLPDVLDRATDPRRVGVFGHSAGGSTAGEILYEDRRVLAAVDLEGYLDQAPPAPGQHGELFPVALHGTNRPLLLLGTDGFTDRQGLAPSWSAVLAQSRGQTTRRQIDDAAHWVFTDFAAMAPQLEACGLMTPADRESLVGALPSARSVPRVRSEVVSFFARTMSIRQVIQPKGPAGEWSWLEDC